MSVQAAEESEEGAEAVGERRVSTLELFFDLVFVFTITQLTVLLGRNLSFAQAGRVLLIFSVLFWMYGAYAYLTNQVPPETLARRIPLMLGMCGFLACALAVPDVFSGTGVAFGLGFLLVVVVHSALYAIRHGRYVLSFALTNVLAALCVTGAGLVHGAAADELWGAALVLQTITPIISSRITGTSSDGARSRVTDQVGGLDPAHFVERHGLLLLIVFGESVIAIGAGADGLRLDWALFLGVVLALALAAALWWVYFDRDEEAAVHALHRATGVARFRRTLLAYYYSFIPMLLGVAVLAAGMRKAIGHLPEPLATAPSVALAGGVALFLLGNLALRLSLGIEEPMRFRVAGAVGALATIRLGIRVAAVAELLGLVAVLIAMLCLETRVRATDAPPTWGILRPEGAWCHRRRTGRCSR
ncbi:low temperature requirement protein LtrA [Streptacidiphilus sp. MAP12-20]|uniref:low temperature requirement protein A n=1 Tax=Streptacidiphilus sp. MAP12-20 TaxID=3156299 RepID=UPI0035165D7D